MDRRALLTAVSLTAAGFFVPGSAASAVLPAAAVAPRARWLTAALKAEGVKTVGVGDWSHHNRDHKGPWGPLTGVVIHHTASTAEKASIELCRKGRSDLPGPLCHGVIAKSGTVYLVGYGRANHAGLGDSAVLDAVRAGRKLPRPRRWNADGNRFFYGFECINAGNGRDPWPDAQLEAIVRASAALCRHHGWESNRVISHAEWQKGKIDPKGFSMNTLRTRIAKRLSP